MKREFLIHNSKTYFRPWDAIFEANPQFILERGERCAMPCIREAPACDTNSIFSPIRTTDHEMH